MVERLKEAIAKARAQREGSRGAGARARRPVASAAGIDALWEDMTELEINPRRLERERIVTREKSDPAHVPFDLLRTRLSKTLAERSWSRIGITSPTQACGKTVISANLAFSLARRTETRTVLLDLDLRLPRLSRILGPGEPRPISLLLEGGARPERFCYRIGRSLAVGLNTEPVANAAELLATPQAADAVGRIAETLRPDVLLCDMAPVLVGDEVLAFLANLDAVILVAAAGKTTPAEIEEAEALIAEQTNMLGVVLNMAEDATDAAGQYGYGYGYGQD